MKPMRRLVLTALAIGFACGAIVGEPLQGPQPVGLPCGTCQSGLTCMEPPGASLGLPVCVRACDAGCATTEICLESSCRRPCTVVNDCGFPGIVDQQCVRVGDAGVCVVRPCSGNDQCVGSSLCTKEKGTAGCNPVFIPPGYCRRTP